MLILSIRTDKAEAEVGLYDNLRQSNMEIWQAHRELSTTLNAKIEAVLRDQGKVLSDLQGIVCFKGPGSFTGLRIGLATANALAYALRIPIVASENPQWLEQGVAALLGGQNDGIAIPEYGSPAHITEQRK